MWWLSCLSPWSFCALPRHVRPALCSTGCQQIIFAFHGNPSIHLLHVTLKLCSSALFCTNGCKTLKQNTTPGHSSYLAANQAAGILGARVGEGGILQEKQTISKHLGERLRGRARLDISSATAVTLCRQSSWSLQFVCLHLTTVLWHLSSWSSRVRTQTEEARTDRRCNIRKTGTVNINPTCCTSRYLL